MVVNDSRHVQPFAIKISAIAPSENVLDDEKIITKIGSTNSFAGLPRMNASKIAPRKPNNLAGASKISERL